MVSCSQLFWVNSSAMCFFFLFTASCALVHICVLFPFPSCDWYTIPPALIILYFWCLCVLKASSLNTHRVPNHGFCVLPGLDPVFSIFTSACLCYDPRYRVMMMINRFTQINSMLNICTFILPSSPCHRRLLP